MNEVIKKQIVDMYYQRVSQKEIANTLGITLSRVEHFLHRNKITNTRTKNRYTINTSKVNDGNPEFWYFVGLFASDGHINITSSKSEVINFTMAGDAGKEILYKIKNYLEYTGVVTERFVDGNTYYYLGITNKYLADTLRLTLDYSTKKTHNLQFPAISSKDSLSMFLRGFIDGDGCFTKSSTKTFYSFSLYCKSEKFLSELYNTIRDNITKKVYLNNNIVTINSIGSVYQLIKFIYSYKSDLYISYKRQRAENHRTKFIEYIIDKELMI